MAKAYSKLLEYLLHRTHAMMLKRPGMSRDEIEVARFHKDLLVATKEQLQRKRHIGKAKQLEKEHSALKKRNLQVLYPKMEESICDSVSAWNKSSSKREALEKFVNIYEEAKVEAKRKGPCVAPADYQHCVNLTVFTCALLNSNRKAVIPAVTNADYRMAKDVFQSEEGGELVYEGGKFYGKVLKMHPSSGACKTDGAVTIFFNAFCLQLMEMLADMACWFFTGDLEARVGSYKAQTGWVTD